MKDKPNSVRTYDSDGYKLRAACICFKDVSKREVLLVTSSSIAGRWVVPGGGIEPQEDRMLAAEREAKEEAGVMGHSVQFLGDVQDDIKKTRTAVFTLIVDELLDHYDDLHEVDRERRWFSVADAKELLNLYKPAVAAYLDHDHLGCCGGDSHEVQVS